MSAIAKETPKPPTARPRQEAAGSEGNQRCMSAEFVPVAPVYAATSVNAAIFRQSAVVSWNDFQYCAFYDPGARVVAGRRRLDEKEWRFVRIPHAGRVQDAHNVISLGVSPDGRVHLAYDHHNGPLRYRISRSPGELDFGLEEPMTGRREERVTYPQFVSAPDGRFYFFYRDGRSGQGDLCLNRYERGAWRPLHHPLVSGEGRASPYWWRPAVGPDGSLHLAWCWRRTPDASTNFNVCYAVSRDGGERWERSDGTPYTLPITAGQAEVADPVPEGANLINQCSSFVDRQGRPHLVHYRNDPAGVPQIYHVVRDEAGWRASAVTARTRPFSLAGGGSLRLPLSRPDVVVDRAGTAHVIFRDLDEGGRILICSAAAPYREWHRRELAPLDVGLWEPGYDPVAWREREELHLWVCRCDQGDHETVTGLEPQMAYVVRVEL